MKPANLTSTLLTRKGQASPTLVGPSRVAVPMPALPPSPVPPLLRVKEVPPKPPTEIRFGNVDTGRFAGAPRAAFDRRVHMSLRLDPGRHLRLRIEASRTGRSMQSLLLQALDEFLKRDGPGTSKPEPADDAHRRSPEGGSRREPSQPLGAEGDGGSTQSQ